MNKDLRNVAIAGAVFALLAGLALYFVTETKAEVEAMQGQNDALQGEIAALAPLVTDEIIAGLKTQRDQLKGNFAQYIKILPSPDVATEQQLLEVVQDKCDRSGLALSNIQFREQGGAQQANAARGPGFEELVVTLTAQGSYTNFVKFLNLLERHEAFLRVNSFSCSPASVARGQAQVDEQGNAYLPLTIALNVSTFRYQNR